ncbi:MAG TPA: serine/threonine-protein kinase [Kofleriaceae bacterium]
MGTPAGQTFGTYVVYEQLGKGGMATVHRAEMRDKNGKVKQIALKRLLPKAAAHKELVASFLQEAKLLQELHHDGIMETFDSGKVFGHYFIAMEYIPGPTLKELVFQCGMTVGAVPEAATLNIAAQLCDALDHAHTKRDAKGRALGIIHRDISPANIILSTNGVVKLIDWGLAKAALAKEDTGETHIKGKYGYVAPEYLGGKLSPRSDLWAVGIIIYELLTSRRLFDGADDFETVQRVKNLPIPRPSIANPRVTPELDAIVMKALERDPTYRWKSAAEMRDALREVIAQPGNYVDNNHIAEWVKWVFTQKPGTAASGVSHLASIAQPAPPPGLPPEDRTVPSGPPMAMEDLNVTPSRYGVFWLVVAFIVAMLVVWKIAA